MLDKKVLEWHPLNDLKCENEHRSDGKILVYTDAEIRETENCYEIDLKKEWINCPECKKIAEYRKKYLTNLF
jgi:hypothetical protein